jgi:hypothetical protein
VYHGGYQINPEYFKNTSTTVYNPECVGEWIPGA